MLKAMETILVPVDGSPNSLRAVDYVLLQTPAKDSTVVHLLNVQRPLTGDVGRFLDHDQIASLHREKGFEALAAAREKLDTAGMAYAVHISVGEPAEIILQYAEEMGCDKIVMGAHGHGVIATLLTGSVASAVNNRAAVPVRLVD